MHNLNVAVLSQDRVNITWHPPQRLNGIIITYYISLFSTTEQLNDWSINAEDDLQTIVNGLGIIIICIISLKFYFFFFRALHSLSC